jgi:hypothetical protein
MGPALSWVQVSFRETYSSGQPSDPSCTQLRQRRLGGRDYLDRCSRSPVVARTFDLIDSRR